MSLTLRSATSWVAHCIISMTERCHTQPKAANAKPASQNDPPRAME